MPSCWLRLGNGAIVLDRASPIASAASPIASPARIVLQRTEPIGCAAIGVDYKVATIMIDAASEPDVWAETDNGKKFAVSWTAGFTATDGGAPPA